jgi:hypothetical protein
VSEIDPLAAERKLVDETDYADLDLELAEDVEVVPPAVGPRSTFALRLDGSTIEELRQVAEQQGTRVTQLAREWLVERLAREQRDTRRLEQRVADLEDRLERFVGLAERGGQLAAWLEGDDYVDDLVIADLEAQVVVARELLRRLRGGALSQSCTVEVPSEVGADLVVRNGDRSWVIEFKAGAADLTPSFAHVRRLGRQLGARPVLVAPNHAGDRGDEGEPPEAGAGVLVTRPDQLDDLVAEILDG